MLASSSDDAGTLSPHSLFGEESAARAAMNKVQPGSKPLELAISLKGKFKTAFPGGAPKEPTEVEDPLAKPEEKQDDAAPDNSLKESAKTGFVVLIADTDMITDAGNAPQRFRLPNGNVVESRRPNGNMAFVENLVSYAAGDTNLLEVRSRGDGIRGFTKYQELIKEAAEDQQKEYDDLIAARRTAERKFIEIRGKQERGEQLEATDLEIARNYEDERVSAGKRIVELRRELRKGINDLESFWKWLNIALIPGIMIVLAISHLLVRKFATSAR